MQRPESNVALERTPLVALAAAPHWPACMPGSLPFFTTLSDPLLACHKRKLPAGVTLNSSRWASWQVKGTLPFIRNIILKETIMETEIVKFPKVHPVIAALEKANEQAVIIRGYIGTSEDKILRLYQDLDTSSYIEIPRETVLHLETENHGEVGSVRAYVRASSEILTVQRSRVRAADWADVRIGDRPLELPPIRPKPTFWTCAGECEGVFIDLAIRILQDEARALTESNPTRQQVLLAQIEQRKFEAKRALLFCLSNCVDRYGAPLFMIVPDPTAPSGFRIERFSLAGYHQILVERHLEKPA